MNKTLALIAALGLVVAVPAFADDSMTKTDTATATTTTDATKTDEMKADKKVATDADTSKDKDAKDAAKVAPAAGDTMKMDTDTMKTDAPKN